MAKPKRAPWVVSGVDPKTLAANALQLLERCKEAEQRWIDDGADPGDAQVYLFGRDVFVGHVYDVLDYLGLEVQRR